MKAPTPLQEQFSMPPTPTLVAIAQSYNGAYISKGGTNNQEQKKWKKNDQNKTTQTFIIPMDNCQTLVILAHNC
jgi:hypothetical protein